MSIRQLVILASLVLIGALAGCGDPVEPLGDGSVALRWQVSPVGCEAAGVKQVEVNLQNAHRSYVEQFRCSEGQGLISGIKAATYEMEVLGLDSAGFAIFSVEPRTVTVSAEKLQETGTLRLSAKPAEVKVIWGFENGDLCGANGVSDVDITVYDDAYYEHQRLEFPCSQGVALLEGLTAGDYIIEASAEGDGESFSGFVEVALKRGSVIEVKVKMKSDD